MPPEPAATSEFTTFEKNVTLHNAVPPPPSASLQGIAFCRIDASAFLKNFPVRSDYDKEQYQHFFLATYDDIYNIVARHFELRLDAEE